MSRTRRPDIDFSIRDILLAVFVIILVVLVVNKSFVSTLCGSNKPKFLLPRRISDFHRFDDLPVLLHDLEGASAKATPIFEATD